MVIVANNLQDTKTIGKIIGESLKEGIVICLEGDLGAGKTTLTQAIAEGMGINEYVTSPTFTIIKEYKGNLDLYHMDAYRLESEDDMYDLGYDEYINSGGVCIIEWASKINKIIPKDAVYISIIADYDNGFRRIELCGEKEQFNIIKERLQEYENFRN